jgi:hypothetical protein
MRTLLRLLSVVISQHDSTGRFHVSDFKNNLLADDAFKVEAVDVTDLHGCKFHAAFDRTISTVSLISGSDFAAGYLKPGAALWKNCYSSVCKYV